MGQSSALAAQRIDLAERVAAAHGLVVVDSHIIGLVCRWEAGRGVTDAELASLRYVLACAPDRGAGGGIKSPQTLGERTGGGGLRIKSSPPFFPHQRQQ